MTARHATEYGAFAIDQAPNQSQLALCHSFHIRPEHRSLGKAHHLKAYQHDKLAAGGYDYAICTTCGANQRQHKVLESAGWQRLVEFGNSATGGTTILWGWAVRDEQSSFADPGAVIDPVELAANWIAERSAA